MAKGNKAAAKTETGGEKAIKNKEKYNNKAPKDKKADKKASKKVKAPVVKADSDSDSDSEEEEKVPKKKIAALPKASNGAAKKAAASSDESSESSSDDEAPKAAQVKGKGKNGTSAKPPPSNDSSDSDSDSDEPPPPPKTAVNGAKKTKASAVKVVPVKPASSSDSDSSSDEEAAPTKTAAAAAATSDSSDDSSDSDDSDVEMGDSTTPAVNGKRKAPPTSESAPKKQKLDDGSAQATATPTGEEPTKTLFVGRLSWNVDNDRLAQEFSEIGEVESARVQMDRNTGKSRGFGYVNFVDAASVDKALETMQGAEIDGRPVNLDRSSQVSKEAGREKRANAFGDNEASGPPTSTLFVGNLSWDSTEDTVWETFGEHGVKGVRLPTDRETGRPKGFGYVEFENVDGAKAAYETLKGTEIDGRAIRMDYSQPRDDSAPRGGGRGGFGDRGRGRGGDRGGFRGRGGDRGGRGRGGGDRGFRGRGGDRGGGRGGRGAPRGGARNGGITAFEGKKVTFD